ncbi:MAG: hypothetical protein CSA62_12535 [Planctomycetota bacterium]|nr:MAG: hypothetical protein CSA62_12535 [Planctomycetota bacterium]
MSAFVQAIYLPWHPPRRRTRPLKESLQMQVNVQGRKLTLPIPILLAGFFVLIFLFLSMRIGRVSASDIGILINNMTGKVTVRMEPGSFFYNDLISDLHTINKTLRTMRMNKSDNDHVRIKTRDGSDVEMDVEINYRLLLDEKTIREAVLSESGVKATGELRRRFGMDEVEGGEAYERKWVRDFARSVVREVFGELATGEFYNAELRNSKARETEVRLNKLLEPHGLVVTKVVPDTFSFYEDYEKLIRLKKAKEQEVQQQKQGKKTALTDQDKQVAEADAKFKVEIAVIKGQLKKAIIAAEAEAVRIKKESEANAYTTKIGADAEFYQMEREAKALLAQANAEVEALKNLVAALEGQGGLNLVMRQVAEALKRARIQGKPYSTSNTIQKVSVDRAATNAAGATRRGDM